MQNVTAKVISRHEVGPQTVELQVQLVDPSAISFLAGQFVEFKIGDSRTNDRSYSIISLPAEHNSELKFCVELIPGGVGSTFVLNLKPGDTFGMEGPFGIFTVKDFDHDAFFVATGVGVAPFLSMIPDMLARGFSRPITLLFGTRRESGIIYRKYFEDLAGKYNNFDYKITLSRPAPNWQGLSGRVTKHIEQEYKSWPASRFYVCGSMDMVHGTRSQLLKLGQPYAEIALEVFN